MSAWPPEDPRSILSVHEAFQPEFLRGRSWFLEVIGTLTGVGTAGDSGSVRVVIQVPSPERPWEVSRYVGARPGDETLFRTDVTTRSVVERLRQESAAIHRIRDRYVSVPRRVLGCEIPTHQMDRPLPASLLDMANSGPGDRLNVVVHLRSHCVQACRFCRRVREDWTPGHADRDLVVVRDLCDRVIAPATRRGAITAVAFEADDLTRHPRFLHALDLVHRASPSPVNVVTPGNALADRDAATRLASHPAIASVVMTLFGSDSATHDDMAGRRGAFREVIVAARNLQAIGRIHLHFHLLTSSASLNQLGGMIRTALHFQASSSLVFPYADYADANALIRGIIPRIDRVREVMTENAALIQAAGTSLVDFPYCAVPPDLRSRMFAEHRDALSAYPVTQTCRRCRWLRDGCVRVPQGYLDAYGTVGLDPG